MKTKTLYCYLNIILNPKVIFSKFIILYSFKVISVKGLSFCLVLGWENRVTFAHSRNRVLDIKNVERQGEQNYYE